MAMCQILEIAMLQLEHEALHAKNKQFESECALHALFNAHTIIKTGYISPILLVSINGSEFEFCFYFS